jgi:hypothetical protein
MTILETFEHKRVAVRILNLGMDTHTPTGKLMLTVLGAIAQFEREMMLERQREGIAKAKSEGRYKGRKPIDVERRRHWPPKVQPQRPMPPSLESARLPSIASWLKQNSNSHDCTVSACGQSLHPDFLALSSSPCERSWRRLRTEAGPEIARTGLFRSPSASDTFLRMPGMKVNDTEALLSNVSGRLPFHGPR